MSFSSKEQKPQTYETRKKNLKSVVSVYDSGSKTQFLRGPKGNTLRTESTVTIKLHEDIQRTKREKQISFKEFLFSSLRTPGERF
jgi:hypothetical protein